MNRVETNLTTATKMEMPETTNPKQSHSVRELIQLSVRGIEKMFDSSQLLFCHRRKLTTKGMVNEGFSRRYTLICLLGLHNFENSGGKSPIHIESVWKSLVDNQKQIDNLGDLGLLIWVTAIAFPMKIRGLINSLDLKNCLTKYPDAQQGATTELSWVLSGLSHTTLAQGEKSAEFSDFTQRVYEIIKGNYGGRGIFRHISGESLAGRIRGRVGSFADQVYPIYAFTKFGMAYANQQALEIAGECASAICRLQGPFGQWWWHYDSKTGRVVGRYPVYSVHQDGMAPMALFAVGAANGNDYSGPIYKGLTWISGRNELGINMVDEGEHVIWRNFHHGKGRKYAETALSLTGLYSAGSGVPDLKILRECWPYHLGWLLYAFADKGM